MVDVDGLDEEGLGFFFDDGFQVEVAELAVKVGLD